MNPAAAAIHFAICAPALPAPLERFQEKWTLRQAQGEAGFPSKTRPAKESRADLRLKNRKSAPECARRRRCVNVRIHNPRKFVYFVESGSMLGSAAGVRSRANTPVTAREG
jgi:hypothetical protein